jgi:hypothetical protein
MLKHLEFVVYCIETYRAAKGINGRIIFNELLNSKAINYIDEVYDALHTFGDKQIVWNIDDYLSHLGASV